MPGLVAVFGEQKGPVDLDPLIEAVRYRGSSRRKHGLEGGCCMAVLDRTTGEFDRTLPAALDGYLVIRGEDNTFQGTAGEERLCNLLEQSGVTPFLEGLEGEFTLACMLGGDSLVVRDPLGVKPLYYAKMDDTLYIAPEIKALVGLGAPIKEAPPGCYHKNGNGWVRYYEPPATGKGCLLSLQEAEDKLRQLMRAAVRERIDGIKGMGSYLSGGLDSSIVAVLAAELSADPIFTFTVGVEGGRDIEFARLVAKQIGSRHHEYIYSLEEMLEVLPRVIYHLESFDCAYVRSSIPNYIAAREAARSGRKVMLTGEGSDELFAGYTYLQDLESTEKINAELCDFLKNLSNTGLQRVDRMNASHGLECRVPFLKPALVELAQQLPLEWKLHGLDGEPVDKWILRRAFTGLLGDRIAWREKEQFDQGSGSSEMLGHVAESSITDAEYREEAAEAPVPVRNKEELYYYRIFRRFFPESVLPLVGRWSKTG